ncbi:hypothetical protein AQUCO_01600254v1 [Aquilegia coerulea]|uniref:ATP-grasp fold succinyl-CoA synthetase-type domain-containing protein n=1 Tax=Aquilegia coerulea TaxID=218851 RepID=A0A2G5DQT0_AQUCA|nr:hypothetical protein AQUCO_01600254v1 [Aquilegia coerulea]
MMRGLINKLASSKSLSVIGKWQLQQQQIRRFNIHENHQGAELMGKYGINVPSSEQVKKAIQDVFPNQNEVAVKSQVLAGGQGLGTFKSGLKAGGVHIVKSNELEDIAGKMLGQNILVTKQTGPQGKVVSKAFEKKYVNKFQEMAPMVLSTYRNSGQEGIKEIMADYVHHEMTRNLFLIYFTLFRFIVIKDVYLFLVS